MREIEAAMELDGWPKAFLEIPDEIFDMDDFFYFLADSSVMI